MTRIHAKRIMIRKTRSSAVINTENMNPIINSKFLLSYGICLGGHKQLLKLTTSSIVYGLRTANLVINSNITLLELVKMSQIIDGIGFYRGSYILLILF